MDAIIDEAHRQRANESQELAEGISASNLPFVCAFHGAAHLHTAMVMMAERMTLKGFKPEVKRDASNVTIKNSIYSVEMQHFTSSEYVSWVLRDGLGGVKRNEWRPVSTSLNDIDIEARAITEQMLLHLCNLKR